VSWSEVRLREACCCARRPGEQAEKIRGSQALMGRRHVARATVMSVGGPWEKSGSWEADRLN
jgi:hypothetical protein